MGAVWMRVRAELRARRRATIALALLTGLGGGLVAAAFAGARRTETAYPRFLRANSGAGLLAGSFVGGESFFDGRELPIEEFGRMDGVVAAEKLRFFLLRNPNVPAEAGDDAYMTVDARSPKRVGPPIDRYKILEGRAPDPSRPEEAVLTLLGSERRGLRIGARFPLVGVPEVFPDFARGVRTKPLEIHIVGLVAVPGDFPPQTGDESVAVHMTPAFYERYPEQAFGFPGGVVLRLEDDAGAADRFRVAYKAAGGNPAFTIERALQDANVQRSIHLQAIAFILVAVFAAVTFVLLFGQTVARQIYLESEDSPSLAALGMTRTQIALVSLVRVLVAAASGAVLAGVLAFLLSPLMPQGTARIAEPSPGFSFDAMALAAAAGGAVLVIVALAALPAWRAASSRVGQSTGTDRPSAVAEAVARLGRLPSLVSGVRLALQRGRGRSAMPVRSTIASVTLGMFVLTAGATFAASLDRFLGTPRLYGAAWDARVGVERPESFSENEQTVGANFDIRAIALAYDAADAGVRGVAVGITGINGAIGSRTMEILAMEQVSGDAPMPPLVAGRYPRTVPRGGTQEIVLGKRILDQVGARVGGEIDVAFLDTGDDPIRVRVVGAGIVPLFVDTSRLGETALMTPTGVARAVGLPDNSEELVVNNLFVATDGGDIDLALIARIAGSGARAGEHVHVWPDAPPADVVNFGRVQKMPLVLGLMLAAFAAATLVHTLVTAIRRRRRDLALLKTIGFVRKQIRRAVRTQALVLAMLALAVGAPAGIAVGRWTWTVFANEQGVIAEPVISVVTIVAAVLATVVLAVLIAALPARAAARTQPALVLRTE